MTTRPVELFELVRPQRLGRRTTVLIGITCYNEEGTELRRSLAAIAANMQHLHAAGLGYQDVLVAVIFDGLDRIPPSMIDLLEELHLYSADVLQSTHEGLPVRVHVLERTVELPKDVNAREFHYPLQVSVWIKTENGGKLNSHLWMFQGLAVQINPKYVFLLDVGTCPRHDALLQLYSALEENPKAGGACGEITLREARPTSILDCAQLFEYKASHILSKSYEDMLSGYIACLPGAFSAYRWLAIRGSPLERYLRREGLPIRDLTPFLANMYLAEDRVLCLETVARRHSQWVSLYVKGSVAETDAPDNLVELILQRRRWLNGALFSGLMYLGRFPALLETDHSWMRKCGFIIQFVITVFEVIVTWLSLSLFFLSLQLIVISATSAGNMAPAAASAVYWMFSLACGCLVGLQVIVGLASSVRAHSNVYLGISIAYGVIMLAAMVTGVLLVAGSPVSTFTLLGSAAALLVYPLTAAVHGELRVILAVFVQYVIALPVFTIVCPIFSFCNLGDVSWGTKSGSAQGLTKSGHDLDAEASLRRARAAEAALAGMDAPALKKVLASNGIVVESTLEVMLVQARAMAAQQHAAAARSAKASADFVADKAAMAVSFNNFRLVWLSAWLLCNLLCTVVFTTYDPQLRLFSIVVTCLVIVSVSVRFVCSLLYVIGRTLRTFARALCPCLFRIESGAGGVERIVPVCQSLSAYAYDDLWELEHSEAGAAASGKAGPSTAGHSTDVSIFMSDASQATTTRPHVGAASPDPDVNSPARPALDSDVSTTSRGARVALTSPDQPVRRRPFTPDDRSNARLTHIPPPAEEMISSPPGLASPTMVVNAMWSTRERRARASFHSHGSADATPLSTAASHPDDRSAPDVSRRVQFVADRQLYDASVEPHAAPTTAHSEPAKNAPSVTSRINVLSPATVQAPVEPLPSRQTAVALPSLVQEENSEETEAEEADAELEEILAAAEATNGAIFSRRAPV